MGIQRTRKALATVAGLASILATVYACGSGADDVRREPPAFTESRFRAISGISMGAFGALNVGTKHPEGFGTIAALGGPVDLMQLLRDMAASGLEVKPQVGIPRAVGDDFTFDHLPPYPGRNMQLNLVKDLFITLGNPFLHHSDPNRAFLANDSDAAAIRSDDEFGMFAVPTDPRGFVDGGDGNQDGVRQSGESPMSSTDVLLVAKGSLALLAPEASPVAVGDRDLADLDGDGVFDVGDGIVRNLSEPFTDTNGDGFHDAGEAFMDLGLDGVAGTGDLGESNSTFDADPDVESWRAEDPTSRLGARTAAEITTQRLYLDVGTGDEFGFALHYENLVGVLARQGVSVSVQDNFRGGCVSLPTFDSAFQLVRYDGGHVGIPEADDILVQLLTGDVCGELVLWRRILHLFGFLDQSFPDGNYGVGEIDLIDLDDPDIDFDDLDVRGEVVQADIPSPALQADADAPVPSRRVVAYLPPEFPRSEGDFPVVYFLLGYSSNPDDFRPVAHLLDILIVSGKLQNMYVVFVAGNGGVVGSFYANHRIPESQVPDAPEVTSGRYEDSLLQDVIPTVEREVLRGRVRR